MARPRCKRMRLKTVVLAMKPHVRRGRAAKEKRIERAKARISAARLKKAA